MADAKISALTAVVTPANTDEYVVNQAATSKKITRAQIFTDPKFGDWFDLAAIANPAAPAADTLRMYGRKVSGRMFPKWIGPAGVDVVAQPAIFGNNMTIWTPTNLTAGTMLGDTPVTGGTYASPVPASTNRHTSTRRGSYKNVVTTLNQQLGVRGTNVAVWRGNAAGLGGFFFFARVGIEAWTVGGRFFVGLSAVAAQVASTFQSSSGGDACGFYINAAGTAWAFGTGDGTLPSFNSTAISGQTALAANLGYDFYIFCPPNGATVYFRMDEVNTGTTLIDSSTATSLPVATVFMIPMAQASNAALTPVNSIGIGVNRLYLESDY